MTRVTHLKSHKTQAWHYRGGFGPVTAESPTGYWHRSTVAQWDKVSEAERLQPQRTHMRSRSRTQVYLKPLDSCCCTNDVARGVKNRWLLTRLGLMCPRQGRVDPHAAKSIATSYPERTAWTSNQRWHGGTTSTQKNPTVQAE